MNYYKTFWQAKAQKSSLFYRRRGNRYTYACPGNIGHLAQIELSGRVLAACFPMFENWHERGDKAYGLYWRTHPEFTA